MSFFVLLLFARQIVTSTLFPYTTLFRSALDSISNIEFKEYDLTKGQYLYLVRIYENPGIIQEKLSDMIKVDRTTVRSEEHTSELQSRGHLVCRLLLEKKKTTTYKADPHH